MVKLLVSFLRLAGQRARRMPRWAPKWGASLSRLEDLRPPSRATTRIESGLGAGFGAHSRQRLAHGARPQPRAPGPPPVFKCGPPGPWPYFARTGPRRPGKGAFVLLCLGSI
jgi:hypothetical protein